MCYTYIIYIVIYYLFRCELLLYLEQAFRISFKKEKATYNGVEYFNYTYFNLGNRNYGMRCRLNEAELMSIYLQQGDVDFKWFINFCTTAYDAIINDSETLTGKEISKLSFINAMRKGVIRSVDIGDYTSKAKRNFVNYLQIVACQSAAPNSYICLAVSGFVNQDNIWKILDESTMDDMLIARKEFNLEQIIDIWANCTPRQLENTRDKNPQYREPNETENEQWLSMANKGKF